MKRLLAILLVSVFVFTGCGKDSGITKEATEYGYFNFENLEWGMTPAEMMKKLGKQESDFTVNKGETYFSNQVYTTYELKESNYLGEKVSALYTFIGIVDSKDKQALLNVKITFSAEMSAEKEQGIWEAIESTIEDYEIQIAKKDRVVTSQKKSIDLPQELQDKANLYMQQVYSEHQELLSLREPSKYEFTRATQFPLSEVRSFPHTTKDGKTSCIIEFKGDGVAYTKLFAQLAEKAGLE